MQIANQVYELIENSFLEDKVKRMYKQSYHERLHRIKDKANSRSPLRATIN